MDTKDLISIIIPVYNVQRYLEQCLQSVVDQSYRNIEIILVDDGSTDNCGAICDKWAADDSRITVIHTDNHGLSSARNTGLDRATGEYIYFVDSDDWVDTNAVEILYQHMIDHHVSMAMAGYRVVCDGKVIPRNGTNADELEVMLFDEHDMWNMVYYSIEGTVVWSKLYKAELWKNCRFKEGIINEDNEVLIRLLPCCKKTVYITKALYNYRVNREGIMHTPFSEKNLDKCFTFNIQGLYFHKMGWSQLEKMFWEYGSQLWCDGMNLLDRSSNPELQAKLDDIYSKYSDQIKEMNGLGFGIKFAIKRFIFTKSPAVYCKLHYFAAERHKRRNN